MQINKCKINSRIEAILVYFSVLLLVNDGLCNGFPTFRLWAMSVVVYGILYLISKLGYKVLVGVLLLVAGTYTFWSYPVSMMDSYGFSFGNWIDLMGTRDSELHGSVYSYIVLAFICYLSYLLAEAFVAVYKEFTMYWIHKVFAVFRCGVGVVGFFYGIWLFVSGMWISRSTVVFVFLLCYFVCLNQKDHVQKFSWLERLIFPVVFGAVLLFAPTGDAFTEIQKWEPYHRIQAVMSEILPGRQGFYFGYTGYGTDAKLKDSILPTYTDALKVTAKDKQELGNIYLIGNVWDTFSDNSWEKERGEDAFYRGYSEELGVKFGYSESNLDRLDFYMISKDLWDGVSSLSADRKIEITYIDLYTSAAFYPSKMINLDADDICKENKNGIQFSWLHGDGDSYELEYYDVDWESIGYYIQMLDFKPFNKEELVNVISKSENDWTDTDVDALWEAVQARRKYLREQYTRLPENFSEKLTEYAESITENAEHPYEKAKLLEAFFQDFEYNTKPPVTPKDENFLERFVLESRTGFCTYFATALTLMCRSVGIPARYVQGFVVRGEDTTEVVVSDSNSHAWTEIYLDGIGWYPLEPTPGYSSVRYHGNHVIDETNSVEEYMEQHAQEQKENNPENRTQNPSIPTEKPMNNSSLNIGTEKESFDWWMVALISVIISASTVVGYVIFKEKKRRKYSQFGEQLEKILEIEKLMRMLKKKGYKRRQEETFREFTERCGGENEAWKEDLMQITHAYEKMVYGEMALNAEEEGLFRKAVNRMRMI